MSYQELISSKIVKAEYFGFDVNPNDLHPSLYAHQRDIVTWAVKGGRRGRGVELNNEYYKDALNGRVLGEEALTECLIELQMFKISTNVK